MAAGEIEYEGRRVIITKAWGPGGSVGKPGDAIRNLLDEEKGKVSMLITVDAAGKLEGEGVGEIAEGVGAAIGGPGVEKYKIEKAATDYEVPMYAVAIKQGTRCHDMEIRYLFMEKAERAERITTGLYFVEEKQCLAWDYWRAEIR